MDIDIDKWRRSAERQRILEAQAAPKEASDPDVAAKLEEVRQLREELDAARQMETDAQLGEEIGRDLKRTMMGRE